MTEEEKRVTLHIGDCLEVMSKFEANSIDAIVSDPPYGLAFMGKEWDHGVPGVDFWTEAHRVAKPGAHLLAFGGTRTYHRLAVAIEDAGWEIRDCVMWVYGSGFPKSLDVSKAIDKAAGAERTVLGMGAADCTWIRRGETCQGHGDAGKRQSGETIHAPRTAPATDASKQWEGWGTALKPAWEPIIVARKPLEGTVAENVLKYGTGVINIGECRVGDEQRINPAREMKGPTTAMLWGNTKCLQKECTGRWPANVIHDGSEEVVSLFPDSKSNPFKSASTTGKRDSTYNQGEFDYSGKGYEDSGSAARFFYCAKTSKADRNEGLDGFEEKRPDTRTEVGMGTFTEKGVAKQANHHPTVKPTNLMRYLVRLVTPNNGIVLDPFMGSGSTGKAAVLEGFKFVGIDLSDEYVKIAAARIAHAEKSKNEPK